MIKNWRKWNVKKTKKTDAYEADLRRFIDGMGPYVTRKQLENIGFFTAPASSCHHLAVRGGLARHSVNVTRWLEKLTESMGVYWPRCSSLYLVGMLHDIVKCKCYRFQNCCAEEKIVRAAHPYAGHGEASVAIIGCELGVTLYPEEASAIIHHMGAFYLQGNELKDYDRALDIYPKQIIAAHTADMLAARFDEGYDHEKCLD